MKKSDTKFMTRKEALRRVPFLRLVSEETLTQIAASGREREISAEEVLCREGEPCPGLLIVLAGAVKVYKWDARNREMILTVERPGSTVLDLPLFDGGNCPAFAAAHEKNATVLIIPKSRFDEFLRGNPEIATAVVRHLAVQMRKLIEMLKVQTLHGVRSRLAAYLLNAANTEIVFPLTETNEAIGSQIGTVREVISRTLTAFETEGLIARRGRKITVLHVDRLRQIAENAR